MQPHIQLLFWCTRSMRGRCPFASTHASRPAWLKPNLNGISHQRPTPSHILDYFRLSHSHSLQVDAHHKDHTSILILTLCAVCLCYVYLKCKAFAWPNGLIFAESPRRRVGADASDNVAVTLVKDPADILREGFRVQI